MRRTARVWDVFFCIHIYRYFCIIILLCSSLESEITSRLRTWRQALDRCRSAPQLCLCLLQLEKAIAWERSVTKVVGNSISLGCSLTLLYLVFWEHTAPSNSESKDFFPVISFRRLARFAGRETMMSACCCVTAVIVAATCIA